jgi:hypothetical protein
MNIANSFCSVFHVIARNVWKFIIANSPINGTNARVMESHSISRKLYSSTQLFIFS